MKWKWAARVLAAGLLVLPVWFGTEYGAAVLIGGQKPLLEAPPPERAAADAPLITASAGAELAPEEIASAGRLTCGTIFIADCVEFPTVGVGALLALLIGGMVSLAWSFWPRRKPPRTRVLETPA